MEKRPLVSIVIPVYNAEKYISNCIKSLLQQRFKNFEIVLVNDGSLDQSGNICQEYANKYAFIKYITQVNGGAAQARYKGVTQSSGEYITFVDTDDDLTDDALELLTEALFEAETPYDIVIANHHDTTYSSDELKRRMMTDESICGPCSKLFKKELLNAFAFQVPREIKVGEDMLMNLRIVMNHDDIRIREINKTIYHYNRNAESLTSTLKKTMAYEANFFQELLKSLTKEDREKFMQELIKSRIIGLGHVCLSNKGQIDKSSSHYKNLVRDIKQSGYVLSFIDKILLYQTGLYRFVFYTNLLKKKLIKY